MGRPSKGTRVTITLRLPPELVARLDTARGVQSRSDFAASALDALLLTIGGAGRAQGAGPKGARNPARPRSGPMTGVSSPMLAPRAQDGPSLPVSTQLPPVVTVPEAIPTETAPVASVTEPVASSCATWPCMDASCPDCFEQEEPDEVLAKRYRRTYGRDSYTPEQIEQMIAAAPVVHRERTRSDPKWNAEARAALDAIPTAEEAYATAREAATSMMAMAVSRSEESIRGFLRDRGIDPDDLEAAKAAFASLAEDEEPHPTTAGQRSAMARAIDSIPRPFGMGTGFPQPAADYARDDTGAPRDLTEEEIEGLPGNGLRMTAEQNLERVRVTALAGRAAEIAATFAEGRVTTASQHLHSPGEIVSRRIASGRVYKRIQCADPGCITEWETT